MTPNASNERKHRPSDARAVALARSIPKVDGFCSQQIVSTEPTRGPTDAVLIDQWGRVHSLPDHIVLGREPGADGIAVLESSVSRAHAELKRDGASGDWWLTDLGSTNGTFVDGRRLDKPEQLCGHQILLFGDIGFVFIVDRHRVSLQTITESVLATQEAPRSAEGTEAIRLFGATSGAGGLVDYHGNTAQLGSTQFALITTLAKRFLAEADQPQQVRGFVRSIELIHELPWDTRNPSDNNVKQLVRRVRRALDKIGLTDAIEARQRFGYRLGILPILVTR